MVCAIFFLLAVQAMVIMSLFIGVITMVLLKHIFLKNLHDVNVVGFACAFRGCSMPMKVREKS
jgi:hypothetical protein